MSTNHPPTTTDRILIVSITPYFLEKGNVWFQENFAKILKARQTQPFFQENTLFLESNQAYSLSELLRKLDELGYEKVFGVRDPGEFSHLGGTVEIFPVNSKNACRIEFVGNKIEAIERLDISADEETSKNLLKKRLRSQKLYSDLNALKAGEHVVHLDHGVAKFSGMETIEGRSYYTLEYASNDKLFVPTGLERKLSRYIGFGEPKISRLSSSLWIKTKRKIKESVEKLAKELLELYAKRETSTRPPYGAKEDLSLRVSSTFQYEETPDQLGALEDIEKDLAGEQPMDRLIAGDVGFGKTEIALRTMVRAVEQGYQAVLLAPTTILAYQHFQTFKERLDNLPINIALLSRIQSKKEQAEILKKLKEGTIDIIIGTHRVLSSDVVYKNLGLLVIDDEQKFGVKQKEKLREIRTSLDVLSLSATPIPRTMYMALSSLKSVSQVRTPPAQRLPVTVTVSQWKESVIKQAIKSELQRKGQVYYLHNRIGTINNVVQYLEKLVPEAKIKAAHAKLPEKTLINIMDEFKEKKFDILVATTIIENGLDIPNVNTLIVEDANKLGLSQAYQIRGRIGRSSVSSAAYFFYNPRFLKETARLRLKALENTQELGSGYRIALRDMEIRGAGNILGKEQSGNVNIVGLNLYCQMLAESVEKLRIAKPAP